MKTKDLKMRVTDIQSAWSCCAYQYQVWVDDDYRFYHHDYILATLKKWFGSAEYFWGNCFLVCKK